MAASAIAGGVCHAGSVDVSLDYQLDPGSLACPGAAEFRREVTRELGRSPFRDEGAPHHLAVRIRASGAHLAGVVEWRDASDKWEGERTFSSRNDTCAGMTRVMALATAIQIRLLGTQDLLAAPRAPTPGGTASGGPTPGPTSGAESSVAQAPATTTATSTTATTTTTQAEPVAQPTPPAPAPPPPTPAPPAPAPPPPPPAVVPLPSAPPTLVQTPAPPSTPRPRLTLELGAGIVQDASQAPLFVVPWLAVAAGPPATQIRLAFGGLGPSAEISGAGGTARLDRLIMTLGVMRTFRADRQIQPLLTAGVGWQRLAVKGTSAMPALAAAHDGQVWSGVATLGGGLAIPLTGGFCFLVELEGLLFSRATSVQIGSATSVSLNSAALSARGGLLARF